MSPLHHPVVEFLFAFVLVSFGATWFVAWCIPERWITPWVVMIPAGSFIGGVFAYAIALMCAGAR